MSYVGRVIHDGDTESLIRKYLKAGVMVRDRYEETNVGTPQGGNLSPLLSNIMLNELDRELESRGQRFTRYADDCVIVVKSRAAATRDNRLDRKKTRIKGKCNKNTYHTAEQTEISRLRLLERQRRMESKTARGLGREIQKKTQTSMQKKMECRPDIPH